MEEVASSSDMATDEIPWQFTQFVMNFLDI